MQQAVLQVTFYSLHEAYYFSLIGTAGQRSY